MSENLQKDDVRMPKLYRRKETGLFQVLYYLHGKRHWKSLETRNEKLAQNRFKKFCDDLEKKQIPESGRIKLVQYLQMKTDEYTMLRKKDYVQKFKAVAKYLTDFLGEKKYLDEITKVDGTGFKNYRLNIGHVGLQKRKRTLSGKTVNNNLHVAKKLFKDAVKEGYLISNPFEHIENVEYIKKNKDAFTEEELGKIFANANDLYAGFYKFLLLTGCRKGEAVWLKWSDVDFGNKEINIRRETTKTNESKVIPMTEDLLILLKSLPHTNPDHVFVNKFGRRHQNISHIFTQFRDKLGLRDNVSLHSFRHTLATHLIRGGTTLSKVSKTLGHSDINITHKIYGHLVVNDLRDELTDTHAGLSKIINGKVA